MAHCKLLRAHQRQLCVECCHPAWAAVWIRRRVPVRAAHVGPADGASSCTVAVTVRQSLEDLSALGRRFKKKERTWPIPYVYGYGVPLGGGLNGADGCPPCPCAVLPDEPC